MQPISIIIGSLILAWSLKGISVSIEALACAIDNQLQPKNNGSHLRLVDNGSESSR